MATCASNVFLGVCDAPCNGPVLSPYENKIGGFPDFFSSSSLPALLPRCSLCGGFLHLLVQVYCPLEVSVNHRLLHLYCCTQLNCNKKNKGWLALRSEVRDSEVGGSTTATTETTGGTTEYHSIPLETKQVNEWCSGADDWGEREDEREQDKETETFENNSGTTAQAVGGNIQKSDHIKLEAEYTPKDLLTGSYFRPMYMNVVEEPTASNDSDQQKVEELLQKYKMENEEHFEGLLLSGDAAKRGTQENSGGNDKRAQGSGNERYEKTVAKHGDRLFEKFKKRLSLCPNQVLRYCWKGEPLLISDSNEPHKTMTCKTCGAQSVFEFQLMPPLVYLLQGRKAEGGRESGRGSTSGCCLEFGTVVVYSCSESCWGCEGEDDGVGFREETVVVVPDPESEALSKLTDLSVN